jgi:hypothetical protein
MSPVAAVFGLDEHSLEGVGADAGRRRPPLEPPHQRGIGDEVTYAAAIGFRVAREKHDQLEAQ